MISLAPRRTHAGRPYLPAITPVVANRAGGGGGVGVAMETPRSRERGGGRALVRGTRGRAVVVGGGASWTDVGVRRAVDTTASKSSTTRTRRRQLHGRRERDPALGMEIAARQSRFRMTVPNRSQILDAYHV